MKAQIITIGDEILIGQVIDTNSAFIAQQLNMIGISVNHISSISDTKSDILSALQQAEENADLVIITGGLGPTKDDITKTTLCEYFDTTMIFNELVFSDLNKFLTEKNVPVTETNRKQAEVPKNCTVIRNTEGTAPCMWFKKQDTVFVSLPGVPHEMKAIFKEKVIPKIAEINKTENYIIHKTIMTTGIAESILSDTLSDWENNLPENAKLAYLPSPGINRLRLSVSGKYRSEIQELVDSEVEKLEKIIPEAIYGYDDQSLQEVVGMLLRQNKRTLATTESCTGGNIAHLITLIPGSSDYYQGSVVAYANKIKSELLGVNNADIEQYGAVSKQVVEQMVNGVRKLFDVDYAIATSGIAGPGGGSEEKPVGTVWIAVANKDKTISGKFQYGNERERAIQRSSLTALNMLRMFILNTSFF